MIAAKEVKPSEIMAVILARIEKLDPKLNAFCTITQDSAMAEARQADKKIFKEGRRPSSPSVSIKDLLFTRVSAQPCSKMHENLFRIRTMS